MNLKLNSNNDVEVTQVYFENGESYSITNNNIVKMTYHIPKGEGDRHYVDILLSDGNMKRFFDISGIEVLKDNVFI